MGKMQKDLFGNVVPELKEEKKAHFKKIKKIIEDSTGISKEELHHLLEEKKYELRNPISDEGALLQISDLLERISIS
ncbi:MAG: hypothetical protein KGD65_15555 [Candidatus Lokiarchaeota archaeon]|nr:hypothetical protein [Candidatus Lokiarchaeota archaeon]